MMFGVKYLRGQRIHNLSQNMLLNQRDCPYRNTKNAIVFRMTYISFIHITDTERSITLK
jgi:hypothetical protein